MSELWLLAVLGLATQPGAELGAGSSCRAAGPGLV